MINLFFFTSFKVEKFLISREDWKQQAQKRLGDGNSFAFFDKQATLHAREEQLTLREKEFMAREEALKKRVLQIEKNSLV